MTLRIDDFHWIGRLAGKIIVKHSAIEFPDKDSVVAVDASKAREKRERRLTQQISLRVSRQVLERTKRRAEVLGVPYQTLIQLWIAERLEKEEALHRG